MLQKWKHIITNWINCYFNENNQDERIVNLETLLTIISHLRENLSLDESKSSLFEAHTVEEFLLEKYPEFKFENGTVEATNEDEIYLAASLLLFFVCVNSKDVNIKTAMCSKLSGDDQEIILKFSKSLLDCSPITCGDVRTAITEACGLEIAAMDTGHVKVAETPPALRSLHGEVRRLQAALDAERFDRNYLQEELARTNTRLEHLLKDKEQYKMDIMNLKAKLSMCGQDQDPRGTEGEGESSAKLVRQLQDMEERLIRTQEMFDDAVYERDTYKVKMDQLKQDRDKWLSLSQQEATRATQLAEELDIEQRHSQSLKELVSELRQHNMLNGLDSSQLECDDPDASIQSLQHNMSVCSEACANVVEVQLGEERAKVEALKQQLQRLQDETNELHQKYETEKSSYQKIISQRENDICGLKHRINEEIEEKYNLKSHYDNEITKLNNEINELEQKIKDNNESSRVTIQQKMQEIQKLQEEKLSLLQSLSDETTKLEHIITDLKKEIEAEKQARMNMRDGYENQMMKLNEKILNRNNELVELQNNVFEKGEMIETLQMSLRKEKELSNKYHNHMQLLDEQKQTVESRLQDKTEEMNTMQQTLEQNITAVLREIDYFKTSVSNLRDHCKQLEDCKMRLEAEISDHASKFEEVYKETENLKNTFSEEIEKLKLDLDERNAIINTLQTHLQDEINFKIGLQEELQKLQTAKVMLSEELNDLNVESLKLRIEMNEKEKTIEAMDLYLKEEKNINLKLKDDNDKLNEELTRMSDVINERDNTIELLNNELESIKTSFEEELSDRSETIEHINHKLANMTSKKDALQSKIDILNNEKTKLEHDLSAKAKQISQLQAECERMSKVIDENKKAIRSLDQNMTREKQKYAALEKNFDAEMTKMMGKLNDTEKTIKELSANSRKAVKNKDHLIHTLNNEIDSLKRSLDIDQENMTLLRNEKEALSEKLAEEISFKNKMEKEYQNQCTQLENVSAQLNTEIGSKNAEIITLKMELDLAMKTIEGKCKEIRNLEDRLGKEDHLIRELAHQKTVETKELQKRINDLESMKYELQQEVKKAYECKKQAIEILQKENEQLQFAMEEDNSSHEVIVKEKDCVIDRLERQLKVHTVQLESIRKDYEDVTLSWEKHKVESKEVIVAKEQQISKLTKEVATLQQSLSEVTNERDTLVKKIETLEKEIKDAEQKHKDKIHKLVESLAHEEIKNAVSLKETESLQNQLTEEKAIRDCLEAERDSLQNEIKHLQNEMKHQSEELKVLVTDKKELLNEKVILTQQLTEERSVRKIVEEEKNVLVSENATIEKKLLKQVAMTESLLEYKECLAQQLVEEKSAKDIVEKEKENLLLEKHLIEKKITEVENNKEELSKEIDHLIEKHSLLDQQCVKERAVNEVLKEEKAKLLHDLTEERSCRDILSKDNESLVIQIESLKHNLLEHKTVQELLINDKELLLVEKEGLVKSLGVEKSAHDEIETEKDKLTAKLNELNELYTTEITNKQVELDKVAENIKHLETDYKNQVQLNNQISTTLSIGLEKLIQGLKRDEITNEVLHKLIETGRTDSPASDKCDLLINIANTLTTELVMRINLEKALEHENSALAELREVMKEKEMQIIELQSEIKRLQQVVNENKIELSKRTETYNTALDNKVREMNIIQQENQSLTNDLNDVKLQLEVKVHSLKEKLIDNENLTDKLKRTYECQIDNLNMMITKVSNYLKDKTLELDAARKEKERLLQTIEDNAKAIKSLEDEVKCEKLNQEKLINDFESERQVLKNMVTVTEAVMEDQKVTLNNIISEHVKANEALQEEINSTKELIEKEKKAFEMKLKEKDVALESVFNEIAQVKSEKDKVENDLKHQYQLLKSERKKLEAKLHERNSELKKASEEIAELKINKHEMEREIESLKSALEEEIKTIKEELNNKTEETEKLLEETKNLSTTLQRYKEDMTSLEKQNNELKVKEDATEMVLRGEIDKLTKIIQEHSKNKKHLESTIKEKTENICEMEEKVKLLNEQINILEHNKNVLEQNKAAVLSDNEKYAAQIITLETNLKEMEETIKLLHQKIDVLVQNKEVLEKEKNDLLTENKKFTDEICNLNSIITKDREEISNLKKENSDLMNITKEKKVEITNLEQQIKQNEEQTKKLREDIGNEKMDFINKCGILQEYHDKAEKELDERQKEIISLQKEVKTLQTKVEQCEEESRAKDAILSKISKEKDIIISSISKELQEEKATKEKYQKEIEEKSAMISELKHNLEGMNNEKEALNILRKENEELIKAVGHRETFAVQQVQERSSGHKQSCQAEKELRDLHHQVDNTPSDISHSSMESLKTISDLEKIIQDKNRTITMLQSDVTYLKTLMAESETKLLDVTKELEISKENCHQLSNQLKKIVHQKNEEIADLKKQVTKMSATENRASQIIKVSAKYQAIILKRIAEIKTNTVLKELTNFGNSNTYDNEVKRSLTAGSITMEDLENFLETTDRHLRKCTEKQIALQKERDRLTEVNRINESEIINLKKFLTELSVSFQTFSNVKDLYAQKLSRVISVQRTVRREILNLEGHISEECMGKLERGYAAVMQDLAECALNLERWVERCIGRTISAEKLKQAFMSDVERSSLATPSFQNAGLEVQLDELDKSFQKLLEEVSRAPKGSGARDSQAVTVMEVRAEYEDKLNRMKAKMKQLYTEQIAVFKEKQKEEIAVLERELLRARDKLAESSRAYEQHIRGLTSELWSVGEKFLMKQDEAEWLRRKQRSGSLMSLQHVHSSGLVSTKEEETSRPSDTHSLRSLPISNNGSRREGRGLHMSDEEGEVFDNRWLKELSATPRRESVPPGQRLSELRWRNSLCPPHLKSSYPAETQFTQAVDEEDIKCLGSNAPPGGKQQRKEVGITAYKKPGPPTPSKQAGRLSATDSELRESLRVEGEPHPSRKTSTPSRLRSLFRSSKNDTAEGTPRTKRLSNIFRKK